MLLTIIIGTLFQLMPLGEPLVIFETKILAFYNPTNKIATGRCCQSSLPLPSTCPVNCNTYFELCLDDLHLEEPNCMFGRTKSKSFWKSNLNYDNTSLERSLNISTSLSWPGVFGVRLQVKDNSTSSQGIIQSIVFVDKKVPGFDWKIKNESGPVSSILYKYRVICATNYYGLNCTNYCKPRDDEHGHYGCNENGVKYCLNGWTGITDYCKTPICNQACKHGTCTGPNICSCTAGWSGPDCSACRTRPGCVNGTCRTPGGCDCNAGWGGNNCDKETDYCGMRKPCKNGGLCINRGLGYYMCYCSPSFTGRNCETILTPCSSNPCFNGATCQVVGSTYRCNCPAQYTGSRCGTLVDLCASYNCQNNGSCVLASASPICRCSHRFTGQRCESKLRTLLPSSHIQATKQSTIWISSSMKTEKYLESSKHNDPWHTQTQLSTNIFTSKYFSTEASLKNTASKSLVASRSIWSITTKSYNILPSRSTHSKNRPTATTSNVISLYQSSSPLKETEILKSLAKSSSNAVLLSTRMITSASFQMTLDSTTISRVTPSPTDSTESILISMSSALVTENVKNIEFQGTTNRSLAVGISVSISFVIVLIAAGIFIRVKISKRRGHHTFRRASVVIPASKNNPCHLIDAGVASIFKESNNSSNNNFDCYQINPMESSSGNSEKSSAISSKDICIEHNMLRSLGSLDQSKKFYECYLNGGYLSEGTSGYGSENSSGRSSANCICRQVKSPLSISSVIITKSVSPLEEDGDLPNSIIYQEEQL